MRWATAGPHMGARRSTVKPFPSAPGPIGHRDCKPASHSPSDATEASTQGGGVWQDNSDGTYTQLRDGFFVLATGYSYLDLYLIGRISAAEVPDFFLLKDLVRVGQDKNGHPVFRAERTKVTIQDVIAAVGPRLPDVDHSRRKFNTGIVVVVEHGDARAPNSSNEPTAFGSSGSSTGRRQRDIARP
jgi:hypothetical protein